MSTFTQYQKLSHNAFDVGLYTTIVTESALASIVQLEQTDGNNYEYERESVNPIADFTGDDPELVSTDPEFTEDTERLRTLYVQSDLNLKTQKLARGRDPQVTLHSRMAKSYARKLEWAIVNGDSAVNDNEFDGLLKKARAETRMRAMDDGVLDGPGAAETELTLDRLRVVMDDVTGGPDVIICNKTMRRKLTSLAYAEGGIHLPTIDMFGRRVRTFDDVPVVITDYLSNSEIYADSGSWTGSTATSIICAKFGKENEGYTLLHAGEFWDVDMMDLGIRKNRNRRVWRMISYPGSVLFSPLSIAVLGGIDSAA